MLLSIALVLMSGLFMGWVCQRLKLPSLLGMLLSGVILGPHILNILDSSLLQISTDLRTIALLVVLTRAGLSLELSGLKKIGRSAFMMCFVPASFEIIGMIAIGPRLLGLSLLESALLGAVLAAVSPAVIVPRMLKLIDEGYGTKNGVPQLILAGASVDDVFAIVMFTTFVGMMQGESADIIRFVNIPVSVALGILIGAILGYLLAAVFNKVRIRDIVKMLIVLSLSFILVALENSLTCPITFSAMIAVMFLGMGLRKKSDETACILSEKYSVLWVVAEVFLFVLVGATVNIEYLGSAGLSIFAAILCALAFRMLGVFACLLGSQFNKKERLFTMVAYSPKATVQAAIGGIPLALGFSCGHTVLTAAVLAIVLTAPIGALIMDLTYQKLLQKDTSGPEA